jgi:hypothetical protein
MKLEQIYTGCLAHAAYYIESNGEAAIFLYFSSLMSESRCVFHSSIAEIKKSWRLFIVLIRLKLH